MRTLFSKLFFVAAFVLASNVMMAQIVISDSDIEAGETLTLTADNEYLLDGNVFVEEGATLIIEAGTVIKARNVPTTGDQSSALIIARGGRIEACGNVCEPIIFTSELDDLNNDTDLLPTDNQLWGGVIILGNAPIGEDVVPEVGFPQDGIEGVPSTELRALYGGTDPADDSGIFKYVSIRHGGSILAADNEINGLTLGGVGSETVIDHVEIYANKDDGFEFFGGTVNATNLVVAFCGDDGLDFDESWNGYIQYAFTITFNNAILGEHAVEYDGSEDASGTQPRTTGRIYNGTFIGGGVGAANTDSRGLRLRNEGSAQFWNCIWTDMTDYAFRWDNNANQLTLANNIVNNIGGNIDQIGRGITGFEEVDPQLGGIAYTSGGGLDPSPVAGSPALSGAADVSAQEGGAVDNTSYRGAFDFKENWAGGWTALGQDGFFGSVTITDADIEAGETLTLTAGNEYLLDGNVFVEAGATLIIEAGTVIKAKNVPTTADQSSALIVARDGRIEACGTPEKPIIFTSELDDLNGNLQATDNQLWGGVIILGNAPIGEDVVPEVGFPQDGIEGVPSTETRALYGGTNPTDNSGIFKYCSIRHGGSVLAADNEINGLTLGGVGSETQINHVEVFANKDDGIEIFGGTVNIQNAVVAFCGDDGLDFDESWNGFIQFALTITYDEAILGEHAVEYDGSEDASGTQPRTTGRIYNGTFIGGGVGAANTDSRGLRLRNEGAAEFWNCIWTDFTDYAFRWDANANQLTLAANIVNNIGGNIDQNNRGITGFTQEDPLLAGISYDPDMGLDPRPNDGSPAFSGAATPGTNEGGLLVNTSYRGAFNIMNWAAGWSTLDLNGYFGDLQTPPAGGLVVVSDNVTESTTWVNTNEYQLDGFIFVEPGATLTIQPGTVIRGQADPSNNDNASALIVARGATIIADGTADQPIIFTAQNDDLTNPFDLGQFETGLWGGLIVLGNARLNTPLPVGPNGFVEDFIEGIPEDRSPFGAYGGTNDSDNSGIIRYVSIRHGGAELIPDEEINGLTLGGVGSGTVVDFVEVYANDDDGIEWFGGTVDVKHAIVAFCSDDSYDYDQGARFNGQFWLSIGSNDSGSNRAGEHDGGTSPEFAQPFAIPNISNVTYIGVGQVSSGEAETIRFRDAAGGRYQNAIFCDQPEGIEVEANFSEPLTSNVQLQAGNLSVRNSSFGGGLLFIPNVAFNVISAGDFDSNDIGDNNQLNLFRATAANIFNASNNELLFTGCPVQSVSRVDNQGGLDPRTTTSAEAAGFTGPFGAAFFTNVDYRGAFGPNDRWADGWSYIWERGILAR